MSKVGDVRWPTHGVCFSRGIVEIAQLHWYDHPGCKKACLEILLGV